MSDTPQDLDATPSRPLVIDARSQTIGSFDPMRSLLGLFHLERLVLAAERSGFGVVAVLADDEAVERFRPALARASRATLATAYPESSPIIPATLLGEKGWLQALHSSGASSLEQAALDEAPLDLSVAGAEAATRHLMSKLVKTTDGFMSRKFARPISLFVSKRLAPLGVTPNQMTGVSMLLGLIGAPFFLFSEPWLQVIGGLLFVAHSVLDGCDGELARLTFRESRFGGLLDFWSDNVVHVAVFACMGIGWHLANGEAWPLYLMASALIGTAGSAGSVYFMTLRTKKDQGPVYTSVSSGPGDRMTKLMDELSRRDFIYGVFILACFGKAAWFLVPTAVGAPVFFILVLVAGLKAKQKA